MNFSEAPLPGEHPALQEGRILIEWQQVEENADSLPSLHYRWPALHKPWRGMETGRGYQCIGETTGCFSERNTAYGISKSASQPLSVRSDRWYCLWSGTAAGSFYERQECEEVPAERRIWQCPLGNSCRHRAIRGSGF